MTSLTCNTLLYLALPTSGHAIHQDTVLEASTQRGRKKEKSGEITLNALSSNTHTHTRTEGRRKRARDRERETCQKASHQAVEMQDGVRV